MGAIRVRSYYGSNKDREYFEGWYFRQQTGGRAAALIPAMHIDAAGKRSASIQVVTDAFSGRAVYPIEAFKAQEDCLCVTIGGSRFSEEGIAVNIRSDRLEVRGELVYGALARPKYDIMGPFRYLPNMQCRHSVISMAHTVWGKLAVNGEEFLFENGRGYLEGDRGSSFPKRYLWTQASLEGGISVMLSVADIPYLGKVFCGVVGFIHMEGREHRIATYLGARVDRLSERFVSVRQGEYLLQAQALRENPRPLYAAVNGGMARTIKESACARVRYRLYRKGRTVFDLVGDCAGYEDEYNE
ncbi:MAG TPA: hypothetical protein VN366_08810 [Feifaniaceae bacterium]|nr:hypothetical protein [Feifaniaceae bacterium]